MTTVKRYASVHWIGSLDADCMSDAIARWSDAPNSGWYAVYDLSANPGISVNYRTFQKLVIRSGHPRWRVVPLVPL